MHQPCRTSAVLLFSLAIIVPQFGGARQVPFATMLTVPTTSVDDAGLLFASRVATSAAEPSRRATAGLICRTRIPLMPGGVPAEYVTVLPETSKQPLVASCVDCTAMPRSAVNDGSLMFTVLPVTVAVNVASAPASG